MVDARLIDYVRKYISAGYSANQIGQALLNYGYDENTIRQALYEVQKSQGNSNNQASPGNASFQGNQSQQYSNYNNNGNYSNASNNKKKSSNSMMLMIVLVIISILVLGGVYLLISDEGKAPPPKDPIDFYDSTPVKEPAKKEIDNVEQRNINLAALNGDEEYSVDICDEIRSDFSCVLRESNAFSSNEKIQLLLMYKSTTVEVNNGYRVGFSINSEVYDKQKNLIPKLSYERLPIFREYPIRTEVETPYIIELYARNFPEPGEYELKFIFVDKYTFEENYEIKKVVIN